MSYVSLELVILEKINTCSYMMMMQCWEAIPENRPSFKEMYAITSKYVESIAGYLDMGFNPFAEKEGVEDGSGDLQFK